MIVVASGNMAPDHLQGGALHVALVAATAAPTQEGMVVAGKLTAVSRSPRGAPLLTQEIGSYALPHLAQCCLAQCGRASQQQYERSSPESSDEASDHRELLADSNAEERVY